MQQQGFDYWTSITAIDKWVALPPGTPEAYVKTYRDAFAEAANDPEFAEQGQEGQRRLRADDAPMT